MNFELRPMGDAGWLVELADPADVHGASMRLAAAHLAGVRDLVPAASSVLVAFESGAALDESAVRRALAVDVGAGAPETRLVEVPVRYGGEDLELVARTAGLSPEEVTARHAAAEYVVAFIGFTPGFPYLRGLPTPLATPRLSAPRPRVPAGSVAIGAAWTGIYPAATPGGWNLIGVTRLVLFDATRRPPALLAPGDRVRFVPA